MPEYSLAISEDEALVLGEYFNRFDDTGDLSFRHPAEYLALQRIASQVGATTPVFFRRNYEELLQAARARIAAGFEGEVPFNPIARENVRSGLTAALERRQRNERRIPQCGTRGARQ